MLFYHSLQHLGKCLSLLIVSEKVLEKHFDSLGKVVEIFVSVKVWAP